MDWLLQVVAILSGSFFVVGLMMVWAGLKERVWARDEEQARQAFRQESAAMMAPVLRLQAEAQQVLDSMRQRQAVASSAPLDAAPHRQEG